MTIKSIADRHKALLLREGITLAQTDVFLVMGQSNAGQTTPAPNNIPFAADAEVAYGVNSAPRDDYILAYPFQNGNAVTPGFGQSAGWPHFAQTWFDLTGHRSVWKNLAVAGQSLVPASIPTADQNWSVTDLTKSLVGTYTYTGGGEDKPRNEMIADVSITVDINPILAQNKTYVLWVQGEADANSVPLGRLTGTDYENELNALINYVMANYGVDYFLIVGLGRKGTTAGEVATNETDGYLEIRTAQNNVANSRTDTLVIFDGMKENGDPFNNIVVEADFTHVSGFVYQGDGVHATSEGYRSLGVSAAKNAVAALGL